jgi:hypothetical protein
MRTRLFGFVCYILVTICGFTQPACVTPPANLVLWLPFDETNGPISANLAAIPYYGTQVGNPTPNLGAFVDNSLWFNGSQCVSVPDYTAIDPVANQGFTLDAWVNRGASGPDSPPCVVADKRDPSSGNGYSLSVDYGHVFLTLSGSNYADVTDVVPADNQWHFIAVTVGAGSPAAGEFYVDGNTPVAFTPATANLVTSAPFLVGESQTDPGENQPWVGGIDEVEMYSRALTGTEIAGIYNAGFAGKCKPACATGISLTCPTNKTVTCGSDWSFDVPEGTSCCGFGVTPRTISLVTNGTNPESITQTWVLTDACGNSTNCSQTVTVVSCVTPPSCLVSWWPGDGNANDIAGPNSGTLQGGATFAPGETGQAFSFNGSTSYVQVPTSPSLNITGPLTLEFWVWLNSVVNTPGSERSIVWKGNNGGSDVTSPYSIGVGLSNQIQCLVANGVAESDVNSVSLLSVGAWYHVALTADGTNLNIYVNGVFDSTAPQTLTPAGSPYPFVIGGGITPANAFDGLIDEVTLYNCALTSNQIAAIYTAGAAGKCMSPQLVCPTNKTVQCGSFWTFDPPQDASCCGGGASITPTSTVTNGVCPKVITRNWLVTDGCGNSNTCSQTVTVVDTMPPAIPTATNSNVITVAYNTNCQIVIPLIHPTASDNCTPVSQLVYTQSPPAGSVFNTNHEMVTVTVTDLCGNSSQCQYLVVGQIESVAVDYPPVITVTNCVMPNILPLFNVTGFCGISWNLVQVPAPGTPLGPGFNFAVVTLNSVAGYSSFAVAVQFGGPMSFLNELTNTGISVTGALQANGTVDPHYTLGPVPPGPFFGYTPPNAMVLTNLWPWLETVHVSQWIAPVPNAGIYGCPGGLYIYTNKFVLPLGADASTASISGRWAADDGGSIIFNGTGLPPATWISPGPYGCNHWTPFTISGNFLPYPNVNTILFSVFNSAPGPTGLRVEYTSAFYGCTNCASPYVVQSTPNQFLPQYSTVTLTAAVSGTPPFTYQWYRNATLLSPGPHYPGGVTGPTLTIASLGFADAGVYQVLAANSCGSDEGTVMGLGVTPSFPWQWNLWNFLQTANPLAATVGSSLILSGTNTYAIASGTALDFGLPNPAGGTANVMEVPALPADTTIQLPPFPTNVTGSYTLIMDLYAPSNSSGAVRTLFANTGSNSGDGLAWTIDAKNLLELNGSVEGTAIVMTSTQSSPPSVPIGQWSRLALVIDDPQDGDGVSVSMYMDGQLVSSGKQPIATDPADGLAIDWCLGCPPPFFPPPPTILSATSGQTGELYTSSIQFHAAALTPQTIAGFGSPANGPMPVDDTAIVAQPLLSSSLANGSVTLSWTGNAYVLQETTDLSSGMWVDSALPFTETQAGGNILTTAVATLERNAPSKFYRLIFNP